MSEENPENQDLEGGSFEDFGEDFGDLPSPDEAIGDTQSGDVSGGGFTDSIFDIILSTEPSIPLDEVEEIWSEQSGHKHISRGIQKMINADGIPAIVDVGIGILKLMMEQQENDNIEAPQETDEGVISDPADIDKPISQQ